MKPGVYGFLIFMMFSFAACGGGGGGGGSSSGAGGGTSSGGAVAVSPISLPTSTAAATATPTAAALSVSGTAQEFTSGVALGGFTVTLGQVPNAATCLNSESSTSMPCGVPASPLPPVTTSATGAFSIAVPAAGTYMLTIGKDTTYATLHRTVTILAGTPLALGTVKIAALTSDEQAWVVDVNNQRATVSVPTSFSNLIVDEYAEEQARAAAAAIASGAQPYSDATESLYGGYILASPGALLGAVNGALDLVGAAGAYQQADAIWMAEKNNCVGGNWQTCTFASNTGHYINISNTNNVWIGAGESGVSFSDPPYGSEWVYALFFPSDGGESAPALSNRSPK